MAPAKNSGTSGSPGRDPSSALASGVMVSKLLNLSEPRSPQKEMIAIPSCLQGLVRGLNEIMQLERRVYCLTRAREELDKWKL